MWAIVLMPIAMIAFGFVSVCAIWAIRKYFPALQPIADRIRTDPLVWGYIFVFGALAIFMLSGSLIDR